MEYKQNVHVLLPVGKFEELKDISKELDLPRAELVREGINMVLKRHRRKGERKDVSCNDE